MKKTIVVFGVTGVQGGSVAAQFLRSANWNVRGITRNASSPSALSLASQGIEIVQADVDDPSTLSTIFHGAHAIFFVTDFWNPYFNAPDHIKSSSSDKACGEYAYNIELRRGKIVAEYAAKALQDEGTLEHFIFSALPAVKEPSNGKYEYVFHFDAKADIARYIKESLPSLQAKTSLLYMAFYLDNIIKFPGQSLGITKLEDNSFLLPIPMSSKSPHPFVDPSDTGIFVDLLVRTTPGKTLLGVGEYISWEGFTSLWTEIVRKVAKCKEMSVEDWDREMPGGFGKEYASSTAFSEELGWGAGADGEMLMPKDLDPSVKLTSVREYIEKENWDPTLSQ